jgi:hypothetical protein
MKKAISRSLPHDSITSLAMGKWLCSGGLRKQYKGDRPRTTAGLNGTPTPCSGQEFAFVEPPYVGSP